jgi:hypothetical protein
MRGVSKMLIQSVKRRGQNAVRWFIFHYIFNTVNTTTVFNEFSGGHPVVLSIILK